MLRVFQWVSLFLLSVPSSAFSDVTMDEVVQGLQRTEMAVQTLSVKSDFQTRQRLDVVPASPEIALHGTTEVTVDALGRCRVKSTFDSWHLDDKQVVIDRDQSMLGVFDGKVAWTLQGTGKSAVGTIADNRGEVSLRLDPRNVSTHYFDQPVSSRLLKRGASIVELSTWDGSPVLVVETTPTGDQDQRKVRFHIDPRRNFTIVRRAIAIRYPPHERWMEYTRIEGYDFREVQAGVWLPDRVVHESLDPTIENASQGTAPPVAWHWDVKFTDWKVNPSLNDETFELQFPLGIFVNNRITGKSYREGNEPSE